MININFRGRGLEGKKWFGWGVDDSYWFICRDSKGEDRKEVKEKILLSKQSTFNLIGKAVLNW